MASIMFCKIEEQQYDEWMDSQVKVQWIYMHTVRALEYSFIAPNTWQAGGAWSLPSMQFQSLYMYLYMHM